MTGLEWAEPTPPTLDRISPSALSAFERCPKRLAFRRDPAFKRWTRRSTRAALGIAAHALTEEAARGVGNEEPRRQWLERRWNELIAGQYAQITADWEGREVPEPSSWRGYVATRTRLLRRLESREAIPQVPGPFRAAGEQRPLPWVERLLTDESTGIIGTPDRVEVRDGQLRVVDLKSGVHQAEMTGEQRRQLLLYAHLVLVTIGQAVDRLVIQDARGSEYVADAPSSEVSEAVERATTAMASFNAMVFEGEVLARPGKEACAFCEFRAVCPDYWEARESDWTTVDARGVVHGIDDGVAIVEPHGKSSSTTRLILCVGASPTPGLEIAVLDLEPAGPASGRMRWDSRIRVASS